MPCLINGGIAPEATCQASHRKPLAGPTPMMGPTEWEKAEKKSGVAPSLPGRSGRAQPLLDTHPSPASSPSGPTPAGLTLTAGPLLPGPPHSPRPSVKPPPHWAQRRPSFSPGQGGGSHAARRSGPHLWKPHCASRKSHHHLLKPQTDRGVGARAASSSGGGNRPREGKWLSEARRHAAGTRSQVSVTPKR